MIEEKTVGAWGFKGLRDAIERRDPDRLLGFYAEDAEVRVVVNVDDPENSTFELRGKAEIARYLRAVCDRDTACRFGDLAWSEDRITFSEVCEYQDGTRVVVKTTLELGNGVIVGQVDMVTPEEVGDGGGA